VALSSMFDGTLSGILCITGMVRIFIGYRSDGLQEAYQVEQPCWEYWNYEINYATFTKDIPGRAQTVFVAGCNLDWPGTTKRSPTNR
jgi:hypothetical protein